MRLSIRSAAALLPTGVLVLLAACGGSDQPDANAVAETKAARDAAYRAQVIQDGLAHDVQCLSALRWQEDALAEANIGDPDLYRSYFRQGIETRLGDTVIPADPPKPELSVANLDAYLDWAYTNEVERTLAGGGDANGDGSVSAAERSGRGFQIVGACIQEVAEMGQGPLAESNKAERMFQIEAVRNRLRDKGA